MIRAGVVVFTLGAVSALGCSVLVDFDESKIPTDETGGDSGGLETGSPDTGSPDTGSPDTGSPDTGSPDTGTLDDTSTTESGGDAADAADSTTTDGATDGADTATADTSAADTTAADTSAADTTAADTSAADTTATDTTAADSTAADSTAADTAEAATDTAEAATDTAEAATDSAAADATDSAEAGATTTFTATLSGDQEIPSNTSTATGKAVCVLDAAETSLDCTVTHDVASPTGMHLHEAFGGLSAGIMIGFTGATSPKTQVLTVNSAQVASLKAGKVYVNVHSSTLSGGEIRGQLLKPGQKLFTASPLSGANQVPSVSTTITGGGSCILDGTAATCNVQASGFGSDTPDQAHIHLGDKATNGAAKVTFTLGTAASDTINGTATATVGTELDATSLAACTSFDASQYYINVHTPAFASGAVRSQLVLRMTAPAP